MGDKSIRKDDKKNKKPKKVVATTQSLISVAKKPDETTYNDPKKQAGQK